MKTIRSFLAQRRKGAKEGRHPLCFFVPSCLCASLLFSGCASVSPEEHAARRATARRIGEQAAVIAMQMAANYYLNQEGYRK